MNLRGSLPLISALLEGVRPRPEGGFEFDFNLDDPVKDVVFLTSVETKAPRFEAEIKRYSPYRFRGDYEGFRNTIKNFDVDRVLGPTPWASDKSDIWEFFDIGGRRFMEKVGESSFDVAITPHAPPSQGGKSQLCNIMLSSIELHGTIGMSVRGGVVKNAVSSIGVDENALLTDLDRLYDEEVALAHFETVKAMIDNAKRDGVFKVKNILPQWRKYVMGFLVFKDKVGEAIAKARTVLFVDDYHTTNATVREVARLIKEVNPDAKLYAYTLAKSYS